jgi:predicted nuclease of predicted toxin-antitoxin system
LRDAEDADIFGEARIAEVVVLTKDGDFVDLVQRFGTPPQILWLTCGNTSNARLREILAGALPEAICLLDSGEPVVEISDSVTNPS